MTPDLVIFDCDGVLVDSEPPANRLLARSLAAHGLEMTVEEVMRTFVGLSLPSCVTLARDRFGVTLPDSFIPDLKRDSLDILAREVTAIPGIADVIDALPCRTCVASSGEIEKMHLTLGATGLLARFDGRLFSSTMVSRGKPAPDLFLHAASVMGVSPDRCVVIEDSPFGLQAAVAAGMRPLGFAGGGHRDLARDRQMLLDAGAEIVFERMADLPLLLGFA
ncbi:MAG: HAD family hydrolase [Pseudomonadota bacterium]|nr:HAD family hydrolase [Pseudomonadota bacterium]